MDGRDRQTDDHALRQWVRDTYWLVLSANHTGGEGMDCGLALVEEILVILGEYPYC